VLLAYTFGQVMWSMFVFFAWILFFWLLFIVFGDLFRRNDIGGWGKAGWTVFVIVLPFIGILVYFITQGKAMGERRVSEAQQARAEMSTIAKRLYEKYSADNIALDAVVNPMHDQLVSQAKPALITLLGAVIFVLLIACGNIANSAAAAGSTVTGPLTRFPSRALSEGIVTVVVMPFACRNPS